MPRLKHFCELCRKQCKDQNGMHCHLNSASHRQRALQFAINPLEQKEKASREVERRIVQLLRNNYQGQSIALQQIYSEYTQQKNSLPLSTTIWTNISQLAQHLRTVRNVQIIGTPPQCKIMYIVHHTIDYLQQTAKLQMLKQKQKEKDKALSTLRQRAELGKNKELQRETQLNARLHLLQEERSQFIVQNKLQINIDGFNQVKKRAALQSAQELYEEIDGPIKKKKLGKVDQLYQKMLQMEEKEISEEFEWILPNIVVKIKPHQIDEVFHNKKCEIIEIVEPYVAKIVIGTAIIVIDQTNLQTVIPKVGHSVVALEGQIRGQKGVLSQVNINNGSAIVQINGEKYEIPINYLCKAAREIEQKTQN